MYLGLKIIVTDAAMRELMKYSKTLSDIVNVLQRGYDSPRKRGQNKFEKWLNKGSKTFNVVIVKDYNEILQEECWVLIHFGIFSRSRK